VFDRFHLLVGDPSQTIPSLPEDADHAAHSADLTVGLLVDGVPKEEIPGKHRDVDQATNAPPTRPDIDGRQKGANPHAK
jgi:hypothetical protein